MSERCKLCGSYAINPNLHHREPGVDLDLCDVCYWEVRAIEIFRSLSAARAEAVWEFAEWLDRKKFGILAIKGFTDHLLPKREKFLVKPIQDYAEEYLAKKRMSE